MKEINKKLQLRADFMLLFVAMSWGFSYVSMDIALEEVSPLMLNSYRFLSAGFLGMVFFRKRIKHINKKTIIYSSILGSLLFLVYLLCTYGVKYTSLSNAGFLCALAVITTPVIAFVWKGKRQSKKFLISLILSVTGMGLLTLKDGFNIAFGDILCVFAAITYGIHLNFMEDAVSDKEVDAVQVGIYQLIVTGLLCTVITLPLGQIKLPSSFSVWIVIIFLSIVCTGMAFIVQAVAQKYTTASHVGVIFSLEPVFAGVLAYFYGERLGMKGYFGALLMLLGVFVMEVDISKFRVFKKQEE